MANSQTKTKTTRVALVGGETLLGRELQEVLSQEAARATVISYAATGEATLGEKEGDAAYLEPFTPESVRDVKAVILAGSPEGSAKAYELVKKLRTRPVLIDCTGHLEHEPEARISAPSLAANRESGSWLFTIAHPAAMAIAGILPTLAKNWAIRQSIFEIFEPASERGKRGVSELHEQTTSLLAFKPMKKAVFDAQLSFNLLAQYGEDATVKLADLEARIDRNLATLLMNSRDGETATVPMPSLRLIQAPVFHGYSISAWVKFEADFDAAAIERALGEAGLDVRSGDGEAPTNVGVASQSGLAIGDIRSDRNDARAAWLWIAVDNLRLTADAAAVLLKTFMPPAK